MKPIHIPPSYWPGHTPAAAPSPTPAVVAPAVPPAAGAALPMAMPIGAVAAVAPMHPSAPSWWSALPANDFGRLIADAMSQYAVVRSWLSQLALFLPGVILLLSLTIVILTCAVLWPYGLIQQVAEGLWLYLRGLQARYATSSKPSEKVALALTLGLLGFVNLVLAVIALPIFIGRFYLRWLARAPVKHTAFSAGVVAVVALVIALIVPIMIGLAVAFLGLTVAFLGAVFSD